MILDSLEAKAVLDCVSELAKANFTPTQILKLLKFYGYKNITESEVTVCFGL